MMIRRGTNIKLAEICAIVKGEVPGFSPYGYIVTEDGDIHQLHYQWFHGVVCAILFPKLAREQGFGVPKHPIDEVDVFKFQRFELDNHHKLPVVRVCPSRMSGCSINKSDAPATEPQIKAMRRIFKALNFGYADTVHTDFRECTVMECYEMLKRDERE